MAHGPRPRLLAELSSGAVMRSSAPDLALLAEVGSGAATCSSAPDLASLPRWAPTLPHGPGFASPRGELRCCHIPHGPQWAVDHRNKEGPSCPRHAAGLTCVQSTVACYQGAYKMCGQGATVWFSSATQAQLTTPRHGYSGDMTR
jgi:hypothetical protein